MTVELAKFSLWNVDGSPNTAALGGLSFVDYRNRQGQARTPPSSFRLVAGNIYGFQPSDDDAQVGTAWVVASAVTGTFASGAVFTPGNQFTALALYDGAGNLWAGAAPTLDVWSADDGTNRLPGPGLAQLKTYLYTVTPTAADLAAGIVARVAAPGGAFPLYQTFDFDQVPAVTTAGAVVCSTLLNDAGVSALVADRVYPNVIPQGSAMPAIVYQVITQVPQNTLDGSSSSRLFQVRMQVDAYARRYLDAQAVAAAVFAVLGSLSSQTANAWMDAQRDLYDNDTQLHRVSMDFSIWL